MFKHLLTGLLVALFAFPVAAQTDYTKYKFGDISKADRALMAAPGDSTAEAYVLFDLNRLELILNPQGAPLLQEYRHRQVKLLRESSFDRADLEVAYYRESEKINSIKATIHLPNGKSIKIPRKDMIRERYDEDRDVWRFTFPGVTEGAIIEYAYTKTDESIYVPSRYFFQENIPVRWAEYRASIPEYFNYVSLSNAVGHAINSVEQKTLNFGDRQMNHSVIRWAFKDLPAYTDQPYVNNFRDYIPGVRLQLASVRYPGQAPIKIFSDWVETTKELTDSPYFGKAFNNKANYNRVWKVVEPQLAGLTDEAEKANYLYNFVTSRISWNGMYSRISDRTPNKVFDAAEGTTGEMAIMLLGLLKEAGIEAQPLLVPLRNSGSPVELYPIITQFNHLMVLATVNGSSLVMDPNSPSRPMGLPRYGALNHRVFVADPANPQWISLEVPAAAQTIMATVALDGEGMGEVDVQTRLNSYYAFTGRNNIREMEEDGDLPIMSNVMQTFPEAELVAHEIMEEELVSGPLNMTMKMKVQMGQQIDDYLYVQPILCTVLEKELVDEDNRLYPVDFGYPWRERYISKISLPEGYVVEELPESIRMKSEDGSISVVMSASSTTENEISLNFSVSIGRTVFQPNEYAVLQNIFRKIIELQESTIVLKKAK